MCTNLERSGPCLGENGSVKTTVELPETLFRRAKAAAASDGKSLKDFFAEALAERLRRDRTLVAGAEPWRAASGALRHLHKENKRIDKITQQEFKTTMRTNGDSSGHQCSFGAHRWRSF